MSNDISAEEHERRIRNLQSVFRHHATPVEERPAPVDKPRKPSVWKKRLAALGPIGVVLLFVLGKLKFLVPLLKFTKFSTLITMFVSVWAYALFFGWPFAVGFVLLIFVHELGHGLVMQQQGLHAGAPVFIPFVGAVIAMRSLPKDAYVEALVGIGGPILGSVGAFVCLVVGWVTQEPFWYALANVGFLINMFNMIPISPLDGGRIVGVISRWIWLVGYAIGIAFFLFTFSPILGLILFVGLFSLGSTIRGPREDYFNVEPAKRWTIGVAYFTLLGLLALGMWATTDPLKSIG
ncbi:MAG: site-2 protease family protein [Acidobacteriota bacterium]|nr:site-2 protease family protein [Acidobacteriota bacterium]